MSTEATSQPEHHRSRRSAARAWLYSVLALAAGSTATAFFATAGQVDPLRDTFFSLAIALDLMTIFFVWRAVHHAAPAWLHDTLATVPVRVLRVPAAGATVIVRSRRRPAPAAIWGRSAWRYALVFLATIAYGAGLGLYLKGSNLTYVYGAWAGSVGALLLAYLPFHLPRARVSWAEGLLVLLLLGVGVALRAYQLTLIPLRVHGDMASVGLEARRILSGDFPGWFSLGWATIPMWGFAHEVLTMRLFGDSLFGLRMSAVLAGTASLVGVYFLGREGWSPRVGVLALAALAVNAAHIHFSRIPSYIDPVPWMVWALYLVLRGYRRRASFSWALAGVCTAVAVNMYFSGRLVIPVLAFFFLYLYIFHLPMLRENREGVVAFLLGFLFMLGPMLIVMVQDFPDYISRARFVSLTDPGVYTHLLNKYQASSLREVLLEQLQRTFLTYQYYGDTSTQFGYVHPMLNPWLAPFFLVGVGVATGRLRHVGNFLLSTWLVLGLVLGSVLTGDAPFWPRLVVILPANALAVALGMAWLWDVLPGQRRLGQAVAGLVLFAILAWAGWQNWQQYSAMAKRQAGENDFAARFMLTLGERVGCYVSGEHSLQEREFAFLLGGRDDVEIHPDTWKQDIEQCVAKRGVIVALEQQRSVVEQIARVHPGGRLEEIRGPTGSPTLVVYWLP